MPVRNDGGEKRRENLHFFDSSFLKSRIEGGNDGGETKTYVSWILRFLNFDKLKEIVGGWRARMRARNEEGNGGGEAREHTFFISSILKSLVEGEMEEWRRNLRFLVSSIRGLRE